MDLLEAEDPRILVPARLHATAAPPCRRVSSPGSRQISQNTSERSRQTGGCPPDQVNEWESFVSRGPRVSADFGRDQSNRLIGRRHKGSDHPGPGGSCHEQPFAAPRRPRAGFNPDRLQRFGSRSGKLRREFEHSLAVAKLPPIRLCRRGPSEHGPTILHAAAIQLRVTAAPRARVRLQDAV